MVFRWNFHCVSNTIQRKFQNLLGLLNSEETSLFLNPTQFNNENDLKNYPYNMQDDIDLLNENARSSDMEAFFDFWNKYFKN